MQKLNHLIRVCGILILAPGAFVIAPKSSQAISFTPPLNNSPPRESTGGASRGIFMPPSSNSAPRQSTGGASRSAFIPPSSNSAPRQSTGGASRDAFIPPSSNSAPRQSTGGASRDAFIPPSSNSAPRQSTGGASRDAFIPPSSNSAPQQSTGGASRDAFIPPSSNSAPQQSTGGASRTNMYGAYYTDDQPVSMKALLPSSFYGTTVSGHPTILVYLPASTAEQAIFSLKDEEKNLVYQMTIPISGNAGIVSIQLPETAPALEVDKSYQWYVALQLDASLSPNSPFVDGWIKRITPDAKLSEALTGKSPMEQSSILAANGVWYDTAGILARLKMNSATDEGIAKEWKELLDSVQLSDLLSASIVAAN